MSINSLGVLLVFVFLGLYLLATQKIYSSRYLKFGVLFTLAASILAFIVIDTRLYKVNLPLLSLLFFFYTFYLLLIRTFYTKVNNLLIGQNWVKQTFANKDFTYVHYAFEYGDDYWDKKLASQPSWLDYVLTYSIFLVPILLMSLAYNLLYSG